MTPRLIRPLAICVFRDDDRILVFEGYDPSKDQVFYRPLGGGIEPGEYAKEAIVREMREEIGAEITNVHQIGTLENIFTFNGKPGHEIVMVFDAAFAERSIYARERFEGKEDSGASFKAVWKSLKEFCGQDAAPLYPNGLLDLLIRVERPT